MRDQRLHWYSSGINVKIFDEQPVSPPPGKVTLVQHKNQTWHTRVERTNAQHSTASYYGRPANRNTQSDSNTLKANPFKTLFSHPFQSSCMCPLLTKHTLPRLEAYLLHSQVCSQEPLILCHTRKARY